MKNTSYRMIFALAVAVIAYWSVSSGFNIVIPQNEYNNLYGSPNQSSAVETEKRIPTSDVSLETVHKRIDAERERSEERSTYSIAAVDSDHNLFTNKVDGYSIRVPKKMKVDMSFAGVRAVLENENAKIEIYRQQLDPAKGEGIESYINYSNLFLNNQVDHKLERREKISLGEREAYFLKWSRKALSKVKDDKCFYVSIDIPLSQQEVLTIFFKSSSPIEDQSCIEIAKSLKLIESTAKPHVRKAKQIENSSWNNKTLNIYKKYFLNSENLQWGIFETNAPLDFGELKKIESKLGFTFPILLYYTGMLEDKERHPNLAAALNNAKKEGRLLELTLQTKEQSAGKGNMVYDVLDGGYDVFLKNYAATVANSEAPILFRLGNEMNGDWCVYSAHHTSKDTDVYQEFYRYVYSIFEGAGADNVIWVWNPNGKSFPDFKWNEELCYYPGDHYVDVVGMTSYNTGTYYEGEQWLEFDQMYDELYERYVNRYDKPLMITEFSSSSVGGSKEAWVANMFRHIGKYDRLRVAVWWDGCDWDHEGNVARPYFIDETEELVKLFRDNLAHYRQD